MSNDLTYPSKKFTMGLVLSIVSKLSNVINYAQLLPRFLTALFPLGPASGEEPLGREKVERWGGFALGDEGMRNKGDWMKGGLN